MLAADRSDGGPNIVQISRAPHYLQQPRGRWTVGRQKENRLEGTRGLGRSDAQLPFDQSLHIPKLHRRAGTGRGEQGRGFDVTVPI
jgi:hypothetical protein